MRDVIMLTDGPTIRFVWPECVLSRSTDGDRPDACQTHHQSLHRCADQVKWYQAGIYEASDADQSDSTAAHPRHVSP